MPTRSTIEPDRHYADRTGPLVVVLQTAVYFYLCPATRDVGVATTSDTGQKKLAGLRLAARGMRRLPKWAPDGDVALSLPIV